MASEWFMKVLGTMESREGSGSLQMKRAIKAKGLGLVAMYEAVASEGSEIPPKLAEDAEVATLQHIDSILKDMMEIDLFELGEGVTWKEDSKKRTIKTVGSFLRDKKGKFISALRLKQLLNLTLYKYATKLMGVNGQLNYQTGRLAHSGVVTDIETNGAAKTVSYQFLYMLYPYQVFDNTSNPNLNNNGLRSPDKLFKGAIESALSYLLHKSSGPGSDVGHIITQKGVVNR